MFDDAGFTPASACQMATRMTNPDAWLTITSGTLTAAINPFGAELSSLTDAAGHELMTDADPAFWTGRAPILFPVVGAANGSVIHVDGVQYPMRKHGFARHSHSPCPNTAPTGWSSA